MLLGYECPIDLPRWGVLLSGAAPSHDGDVGCVSCCELIEPCEELRAVNPHAPATYVGQLWEVAAVRPVVNDVDAHPSQVGSLLARHKNRRLLSHAARWLSGWNDSCGVMCSNPLSRTSRMASLKEPSL